MIATQTDNHAEIALLAMLQAALDGDAASVKTLREAAQKDGYAKAFSASSDRPVMMPTQELLRDPTRFQFREDENGNTLLDRQPDAEAFDPERCPPLKVWRDPDSGLDMVVDGHARHERAERDGVDQLPVQWIEANDANDAREQGRKANKFADGQVGSNPPFPGAVYSPQDHHYHKSGATGGSGVSSTPNDKSISSHTEGQPWESRELISKYYKNIGEKEVRLDHADITVNGETHTAYRWTTKTAKDGMWTFDKNKAIAAGKQFAEDNDEKNEKNHQKYYDDDYVTGKPNEDIPSEARPKLDEDAKNSLWNYSWGYDGQLNQALRSTGQPPTGDIGGHEGSLAKNGQKMFSKIREAFEKTKPFPEPITVYRGIKGLSPEIHNEIATLAKTAAESGGIITLPGFVSTSTNKTQASRYTSREDKEPSVFYTIRAKQGLDIKPYSHFPQEDEFLLNHNCQYKVLKSERKGKMLLLELEQINNGNS